MSTGPVEGALVDQRYELLKRETDRGLGESWQARDTRFTSRLVTVKFLAALGPDQLSSGALPPALDEHLQAVRRLRHESVLTVVNHGLWGAVPYVVHEAFDGRSLGAGIDDARATGEVLTVALLQALFEKVCAAVRVAHRAPAPVLHLGLAPSCVLVRRTPGHAFQVKLVDFGVAFWAAPDPSAPARSARAMTLPAPEQLHDIGEAVSPATDVFALGCLLREMLALPPPSGQTLSPAGLDRRRPDVSQPVWDVITIATNPSPSARYASVDAMLEPLRAAWLVPVPPPVVEAPRAAPAPQPQPRRLDAPPAPRPPSPVFEDGFVPFVLPPLPGVPSRGVDYAATLAVAERAPSPTPWDTNVLSALVDAQSLPSFERVGDFLQRMQAQSRASTPPTETPASPASTVALDASWTADGGTLIRGASLDRGETLHATPSVTSGDTLTAPPPVAHTAQSWSPPTAVVAPARPYAPPPPQPSPHQAPQPRSRAWVALVVVAVVAALALALVLVR